ncbi:MAG TPA: MHYT domain-containing protein [Hyphomicrobiaceae bacterium]|nr:MHYT domain-containing protein [Hyphomicrobiaceae bacterium]
MTVTYQPGLVLLSILVAILGSLTALALTSGKAAGTTAWRALALANGGLMMGLTIWSMHFIAMMAVNVPVPVTYNLAETLGSVVVAIVATGFGLYLAATRRLGPWSVLVGGTLMGLGIAGMHYMGMGAIRGCGLAYDAGLVAASIAIAIVASMAALWFAFVQRGLLMTVAGGVVQGLAIASMHYTAMAATHFLPLDAAPNFAASFFPQSTLAWMIAFGVALMSLTNFTFVGFISLQRNRPG